MFLEVNLIFILKEVIKTCDHDFQHFLVSLTRDRKKYGPINPLENRLHHTATPGRLTDFS